MTNQADASRRVRVWFGSQTICSFTSSDPAEIERYRRSMAKRFAGLNITVDDQPSRFDPLLPPPVEWDMPPIPTMPRDR